MRPALALLLILPLSNCAKAPETVHAANIAPGGVTIDAAFWKTWGDGQAELSGYDLTYPRYGQLRKGVAVTIFVSETFAGGTLAKPSECF